MCLVRARVRLSVTQALSRIPTLTQTLTLTLALTLTLGVTLTLTPNYNHNHSRCAAALRHAQLHELLGYVREHGRLPAPPR